MFKNGTLWNDIDGNPIHAHGGWMLSYGGYFYWYGEDRRENYYVSCYRSKDLRNWEFRNHILTTESKMEPYRVRTKLQLISETGGKVNLERPKVLYNKKMEKFVLWVHFENGKDYTDAAIGIAECDTPDGDFVYHGHFNPYGYMSRDCTLFQEEDGTAYFISAARDNADLHVYRLSEDYLNVEKTRPPSMAGRIPRGTVSHQKRRKILHDHLLLHRLGAEPGKIRRSRQYGRRLGHVEKKLATKTTYQSQAAFLLNLNGQLLYIGDRWNDGKITYESG